MTTKKMWGGIPTKHMQWLPCPQISSPITRSRYVETIEFENGGGDAVRSKQYRVGYPFEFVGPAHEVEGIDAFGKLASGFYGDGLMHVAHPANFERNIFAAAWASPGLIEQGWANIYSEHPTYSDTVANSYGQPPRTATFAVTSDVEAVDKKFTIAIPPTHTLHIGASGSATGTAVVRVRPINSDNSYAATSALALLNPALGVRMNSTFSGSSYQAVEVYITRTSLVDSTLTLTSMMAQLYRTELTPTLPSVHIEGTGSTGMEFVDDAVVEEYTYMFPPRKGISTTLMEVEAWR